MDRSSVKVGKVCCSLSGDGLGEEIKVGRYEETAYLARKVMENWRQRLRQQNLNNGRRTQAILRARREENRVITDKA